jgi:hypothetical protein
VEQSANISSYRWTLCLASAYALTELTWALFAYDTLNFNQVYIVRVVIALIIPIGLLLHSSVVRHHCMDFLGHLPTPIKNILRGKILEL